MSEFLSEAWLSDINEALRTRTTPADAIWRIVLEWSDGPHSSPHAMTFSGVQGVVSVALGDHLAADAIITLGYSDAKALSTGELDAAKALHEGRIKLRGDASALVAFMNSLRA